MMMAFERLCFILLVQNPIVVVLPAWIGVGCCGCPVSSKASPIGVASLEARKMTPTSDSIFELMTMSMIFASV